MYCHKTLSLLIFLWIASIMAVEPTLEIVFDKPKTVKAGTTDVKIDGEFTEDGYLKYGKKGIRIPATGLLSDKGTVIVDFRVTKPQGEFGKARNFVTLRNKGRLLASIYTLAGNPRHIFFQCTDYGKQNHNPTFPGELVDGRPYQAAFSYDGNVIRTFLNGKMVDESRQECQFDAPSFIAVGPFVDGWYNPPPWDDDCQVRRLQVFDAALTVEELFARSSEKPKKRSETETPMLSVPKFNGKPSINGELGEHWEAAASLPSIIDAVKNARGWEYPENRFLLSWDDDCLYLGTRTVFPRNVDVKQGSLRDENETDVWGAESWEFYLKIGGHDFRFGGNVAGGFVERKDREPAFNGKWDYKSTFKMRIDDRFVWESESAIPWKTLGMDAPPKGQDIRFNFCRSWFLPDLSSYGSLTESGDYITEEEYPVMRLVDGTAVMQSVECNNPCMGRLEQKMRLAGKGRATVMLQLAHSLDLVPAKIIFENSVDLDGTPVSFPIDVPISGSAYDRLQYTLFNDGKVVARQMLPLYIVRNYLKINPNLLSSTIGYEFKSEMFAEDFPAVKPTLQLRLADGTVKNGFTLEKAGEIEFDRRNPRGNCFVELVNPKDNATLYSCPFVNPGIGEWESMVFDDRIIPPFTPLEAAVSDNGMEVSMWGRNYSWRGSLLPVQLVSQNEKLLSAPISIEADGNAIKATAFKAGTVKPHRAEFSASASDEQCAVTSDGWVEYDGVNYNRMRLVARKDIAKVKVKVTIPLQNARFLHTSMEYFWGNKITAAITPDFRREIGFFPVVWIGDHEKGVCVFTETRQGWNSSGKSTMAVSSDGRQVTFEISPFVDLKAGEQKDLELGFLCSPVKPLPKNYPLNTFADHHMASMNRPGRRPTTDIMLSLAGGYSTILGDFFCDIPSVENSVNAPFVLPSVKKSHDGGGRSVPYLLSRTLSDEYPEIAAYQNVWRVTPGTPLDYMRDNQKHAMPECCPASGFSAFHAWKIRDYIKRIPTEGIYLDGAIVGFCSNSLHGCNHRIPLLAQREFYRRVILVQLDCGIKDPVLVLHNTDSVQLPAFTFSTHLFNGEQIRQSSSTIMHNGKDILDTYDTTMFASELSSLPFGITNSVYQSNDILQPMYGGDPNEDPQLYKFRITKPMLAGALVHNTMPSLSRCHFGLFDKVIRAYDAFDVPNAIFIGYWKKPATIHGGKDVFASVYCHPGKHSCLAVVSHIGKEHISQNLRIDFNLKQLGIDKISSAREVMSGEDKEYDELFSLLKNTKIDGGVNHQLIRTPIKWGDPGVKLLGFDDKTVNLELNFHSFALILLNE